MNKPPVRLAPDERWQIEVDVNYIHSLRIALNLATNELAAAAGMGNYTLTRIGKGGNAQLFTVAKLATFFNVQPGELLIWYPVPKDYPYIPIPQTTPAMRRKRDGAEDFQEDAGPAPP